MIKKMRQNKTWIEEDIPCINPPHPHPNQHNALDPAIAYVSNNFTIPVNSMTSEMNTIATQRTFLRARVYGTEIVLKSSDRSSSMVTLIFSYTRARPWLVDSVCIKGNQLKLLK